MGNSSVLSWQNEDLLVLPIRVPCRLNEHHRRGRRILAAQGQAVLMQIDLEVQWQEPTVLQTHFPGVRQLGENRFHLICIYIRPLLSA